MPSKKQKIDESLGISRLSLSMSSLSPGLQQLYGNMDPIYLQCLQEFSSVNRHFSAFKPVVQSIKESKIRHANALGISAKYNADIPVLQNPERVVPICETEQFESSFQPNVALAPPSARTHRCRKNPDKCTSDPTNEVKTDSKHLPSNRVGNEEKNEKEGKQKGNELTSETLDEKVSDALSNTVLKYNPEIELSTDTEDSASETSDKNPDISKLEETLKSVDTSLRDQVLEFFVSLTKEHERVLQENREKDNRIRVLELRNSELSKKLEEIVLKCKELVDTKKEALCSKKKEDIIVSSSSIIPPIESSTELSINNNNNNNNVESQKSVITAIPTEPNVRPKIDILNTTPE